MAGQGGKRAGAGRKKGSLSSRTIELKDMILAALDDAGGQRYLAMQAVENPSAFLTLVGKVLPKDIKAEVTGANGGPLVTQIQLVAMNASTDRATE